MSMSMKKGLLLLLAAALLPLSLRAEETRLAVRVISHDAKFVGTSMGGARIRVEDLETGELLATGVTAGSTGDTDRIMRQPRGRHGILATEGAARWETVLDLDEPRPVRITARGPLAQRQALAEASTTLWLLPGKDLTAGDGVLLALRGFVVDVLAPPAHSTVADHPPEVEVRANLTMMCGCPTAPGGLWDADGFELRAVVRHGGEETTEVPLSYAGDTSQFTARIPTRDPGLYDVLVYAYDPVTGNTGLDRTTFVVAE